MTMPSTRLALPLSATSNVMYVTDAATVVPASPNTFRDPGDPLSGPTETFVFSEQEAMRVNSVRGNIITIERGVQGTYPAAHNLGMMVFSAPGHFYNFQDPVNPVLPDQTVLPVIVMPTGKVWNGYATGTRPGLIWAQATFTWNSTGPQQAQQPWTDSTLLCQVASVTPPVFFPDTSISPCIVRTWAPGIQWTESNFTWSSQEANWKTLLNIS
jgi:hypothetical protein